MYIYIYDVFANEKKYETSLAKIETRITDLGMNGKIVRLSIMSSLFDIIRNELKKGAKTIVVVGNNTILNQGISALAKLAPILPNINSVPLGFIPIGKKNNSLSAYLGISNEDEACNILSSRRIKKIKLGLVNNDYFLFNARITTQGTTLEIDKIYSIKVSAPGEISISNFNEDYKNQLALNITTTSGKNFLNLNKSYGALSTLSFKELSILNKNFPLTIDDGVEINCPMNIRLAVEQINLIVGKQRLF